VDNRDVCTTLLWRSDGVGAASPMTGPGRRFLEFFAATIRNKNTRMASLHVVGKFFASCGHHRVGQLADIESLLVHGRLESRCPDSGRA
jgi:hypothetical protein